MSRTDVIRVLVVDDDARVRRALHDLIEASEGMQVVATAGDVTEALQADGISLVRALKMRGRPVVATSVSAAVRNDALAAGACGFVEKALDDQRLLTALRRSAEQHLDE
jgi:DNA-binding NarL/FixJ family response regulator